MFKDLGLSVYVSAFARQKQSLEALAGSGTFVFTSFHIQEEFDADYVDAARAMSNWLKSSGFRILADVSPKTLKVFGHEDILGFARELGLDILRLDYGFSLAEMLAVAEEFPLAFNASTVDAATAEKIVAAGGEVYAMHNFYPRPETGLDPCQFARLNAELRRLGIKVLAFIPGDEEKRGPIHAGLPTVEAHRSLPPYLAYLEMAIKFGLDGIFLGDLGLSSGQRRLIAGHCRTGVVAVPSQLLPRYRYLYDQVFTIRPDSPLLVKRIQESREYSCPGDLMEPDNCGERAAGAITMDNRLYGRYSGEIQILARSLPQDERVNVIGQVSADYIGILPCLTNSGKIKLVPGP